MKYLLLLFAVLTFAQETISDTVQLSDMIFSESDRNTSLKVIEEVGRRADKNYAFYPKVNYPFSIEFQGKTCRENYTGEISFNKILNSGIRLDNFDAESCLVQELGSAQPLYYMVFPNIKWLDNLGGIFSKKRIKNAKYGSLREIGNSYVIITKRDKGHSYIEVDKTTYAITKLEGFISINKDEDQRENFLHKLGDHQMEVSYVRANGRYHPQSLIIDAVDGRKMHVTFGEAKKFRKLKNDKNGMNLLRVGTDYNVEE